MFINKLNLFGAQRNAQADPKISLKPFIDIFFDTIGWYSLGHHEPEQFLRAIVNQNPHSDFSPEQVHLTWAKFEGDNFEMSDLPIEGAQAITLVEDWGEC